ncbi:MAG: hypothetical protein RLY20_2906 [Verrucomicrobiota bacterium]
MQTKTKSPRHVGSSAWLGAAGMTTQMCGAWQVIDTPCRPRRWKIVNPAYRDDNSWTNYFVNYGDALIEADKRNAREKWKAPNSYYTKP